MAEYLSDIYDSEYDDWSNFLVYNTGRNVSPNFNFMLRVEGLFDLPCRRVHSFTKANEYEYIQEGGLNDYVHMRRKPVSQPFTFQVERYVGVDYLDPLQPGTDLILPIVLFVCRMQMKGSFMPFRTYTFTGCTVMSKEYGELNAESSGLHTETTTIGYRELVRITLPDGILEGIANAAHRFDFEVGTDKKGNKYLKTTGKHSSARKPPNDSDRRTPTLWRGSTAKVEEGKEDTITKSDGTTYKVIHKKSSDQSNVTSAKTKTPEIWLGNSNNYKDGDTVQIYKSDGKTVDHEYIYKKRADQKNVNAAKAKTPNYWTGNPALADGTKAKVTLEDGTSYDVIHKKSANQKGNKAVKKTPEMWLGSNSGVKEGEEKVYYQTDGKTVDHKIINRKRADNRWEAALTEKVPRYYTGDPTKGDGTETSVTLEDGTSYKVKNYKSANQKNNKAAKKQVPRYYTGDPNKGDGADASVKLEDGTSYAVKNYKSANQKNNKAAKKKTPEMWLGNETGLSSGDTKKYYKAGSTTEVDHEVIHKERAAHNDAPTKDQMIAKQVLWAGIQENQPPKAVPLRANKVKGKEDRDADRATQVLWDGIQPGKPANTETKRANFVDGSKDKNAERATQVVWDGIQKGKPPRTETKRANSVDGSQAKNAERAEVKGWNIEGQVYKSDGSSVAATPVARRQPSDAGAKLKNEANAVLWAGVKPGAKPTTLRALMANALK